MICHLTTNKDIWHLALQILTRRSHSEYELRQKLYQKSYAGTEVDQVVNRLLTYGYLNDTAFATALFSKYLGMGKYSLNNIICKLKKCGLPEVIIKTVIREYDGEEEYQAALKVLGSRFKSLDGLNKEKLYRFLGTRGFSSNTIHRVLDQLTNHDF